MRAPRESEPERTRKRRTNGGAPPCEAIRKQLTARVPNVARLIENKNIKKNVKLYKLIYLDLGSNAWVVIGYCFE